MFTSPHPSINGAPSNLVSYDSAPGSLLTSLGDTIIGASASDCAAPRGGCGGAIFHPAAGGSDGTLGRLFTGDSQAFPSDSGSKAPGAATSSFGMSQNPLARQSSLPAGFFSHLLLDNNNNNGSSLSRDMGNNNVQTMYGGNLKTQLSVGASCSHHLENTDGHARHSYTSNGFTISSWDDTDSIVFSTSPGKRSKANEADHVIAALTDIDSQFSLPKTSQEMVSLNKFINLQQDQIPFKVRAKRGCATHPRSIAERERRTRISEKLRKLQELVPNMDKQTSTSDMLDLAVQHINELQSQLQTLHQERETCTCTSKR